ncbi:MAG: BBP7 family outer membrane beta-barrel protein [Chlamydiales bacterium]|nr:BBP7 family outer membrane beta-barrel protein [Chlamydiales bacterium]
MRKLLLLLLLVVPQCAHAVLPYCGRLQLPGWWGSAEYMLVWRKKRFYPPLVTTSNLGTLFEDAGILGLPTTRILFGNEYVGNSPQSGGRFDAGFWLTPCLGFGATWTLFGKEHFRFNREGSEPGIPILAIPFFDTANMEESAVVISHPEEGPGSVQIDLSSNIWAADVYTRWGFWNAYCFHIDLLGGFRYVRLNDSFNMTTQTIVNFEFPPLVTEFETFDLFKAENAFYSGLVGIIGEYRWRKWAFQVCGRFGIGNMVKKVNIQGEIIGIDVFGEIVIPEGIFAQDSNIGIHTDNSFEVVSEAEAKIGYYVWSNLMVTAGYHFMYWPKVFLAGEQIDRNVNFEDLPPGPRFPARDTNFWTQSLTVGIYFLY